jgi:hypothetical protein
VNQICFITIALEILAVADFAWQAPKNGHAPAGHWVTLWSQRALPIQPKVIKADFGPTIFPFP